MYCVCREKFPRTGRNIMRVERLTLEMEFVMEELLPLAKKYHITA